MLAERLEEGIHVSSCTLSWDIAQSIGLVVPYTGWHTGWHDFRLVPDLEALYPTPWLEKTALCVADIIDEETGELLPLSPRTVLRRQIDALRSLGYEPYIGSELEFHMYQGSYDDARLAGYRNLRPTTLSRADYSIQQSNVYEPFFRHVRAMLDEAGLQVELSQGEWGLGQWEINLLYADALRMADRHVLYKLALKDMASAAGMAVTFMPRPNAHDVGSSCHLHLSLRGQDDGHPFFAPGAPDHMSPVMRQALAGILGHAGELMVFYAPTINAYRRTNSDEFAGRGATWSFDNRTTSCRILGHSPASLRIEYRVPGADINPHLGFAALLTSAIDGIKRGADPGEPIRGNAYELYTGMPLPADLSQAAEAFEGSDFARGALGEDVIAHYAAVARFEWAQFMHAVTDWEKERYFEVI
jgi:glutamine synthetase